LDEAGNRDWWRVPYQRAIMQVAAQAAALRLALLYIDDAPAAAQCWIVSGGVAHLHRLAYDERFRELSPGTVLSWHVIRHVLDVDHVRELDFGVGDDAYKAEWVSGRRERWGILAFNPRTWGGLKAAAVNIGGHAAKSVTRVVLHPLLKRLRGADPSP
jgi:CelD/BcsL family acetyltransferase involved in cellulose biosynthesis